MQKILCCVTIKRSLIEQATINFNKSFGANPFFNILPWQGEGRTNKTRYMHICSEEGYSLQEERKTAALQQSFCVQLCVMERERKKARKWYDLVLAGVSFSFPP